MCPRGFLWRCATPKTQTEDSMARLLRIDEVRRRTGLSRTSLWRKEKEGTFPSRVKIGANSVAWREEDIEAWIESRPRARAGSDEE